jgi:mannose-6-phosphate isomerase-like protein (cupin superfamily)
MKTDEAYFDNKVIQKPWGLEYVVLRIKNLLSVTFLEIKPGKKTSLHCHTNKKTGFIVVQGKAKLNLGIVNKTSRTFDPISKITIHPRLFHSIKCVSKIPMHALEFETPADKNDLVRFDDKYGRINKSYETKFIKMNKNKLLKFLDIKKFQSQNLKHNKVSYSIQTHKNFKKILKEKGKTIFAVLGGNIVDGKRKKLLKYGDTVTASVLKKFSSFYKIEKNLTLLKVTKN